MSFVEFLEALARACDMSSLGRPSEEVPEEPDSPSKLDPRNLPLQYKIINALKRLIFLCKPTLQASFTFPTLQDIEMMKYKKPD